MQPLTVCNRYKLTDKLSERLEEMGKDLTAMITEINDASSKLSKNSKTDDPVSSMIEAQCNSIWLVLIGSSCLRSCEYLTATWLSCNR